jgi:hypothetical protein
MAKWAHAQALVCLRVPTMPSLWAGRWTLACFAAHLNQDRLIAETKNGRLRLEIEIA